MFKVFVLISTVFTNYFYPLIENLFVRNEVSLILYIKTGEIKRIFGEEIMTEFSKIKKEAYENLIPHRKH